jgi:hypothetical protein
MTKQLHKRFTTDQIKIIFQWYCDRSITSKEARDRLEISEERFFQLLRTYRKNSDTFTIDYPERSAHNRFGKKIDKIIRQELEKDKSLIDNPNIPLKQYNYSAVRDEVTGKIERSITSQTIRNRARDWGYVKPKPPKKKHDRIVLTSAVGMLFQHDSSRHLWTPYAKDKWSLITTLDDFSRKLLFADFLERETAWNHIKAVESTILTYGTGLAYYVDNHSIFRFVSYRDSFWYNLVKGTDEVMTQWKRVVKICNMKIFYATSPQAKGKIERPYRWLQDRIVRKCAKEGVKRIDEARAVLKEEVDRYNSHQVHSTTKEIPDIKFEKAINEGNSVLKSFTVPKGYQSTKDIFCLYETRRVDGYQSISWRSKKIKVPRNIPTGSEVVLHIIPDKKEPELRVCYQNRVVLIVRLKPK